jgi:hypothetical protein
MPHFDVIAHIRDHGKWTPKLTPDEDEVFASLVPDLVFPVRGLFGCLKEDSRPPSFLVEIFFAIGFYLIFSWLFGFSAHGDGFPTPDVLVEHPMPALLSAIGAAGLLFGPLWILHSELGQRFEERVKSSSADERLKLAKNLLKIAQCYDGRQMVDPETLERAERAGLDKSIVTRGIDEALSAFKRSVTFTAELLVADDYLDVRAAYYTIASHDGLEKDLRDLRKAVDDLPHRVDRLIEERDRLIEEKEAADQLARRRSEVKEAAEEFTRK